MIRKYIGRIVICLSVILIGTHFGVQTGYAQSTSELQSAISNGTTDIQNFFNSYSPDQIAANVDPNVISQALGPANGGLNNMLSQWSPDQVGNFINELSDVSNIGAELSGALTNEIASSLPAALSGDILEELTSGTLGNIEAALPGSLATLADINPTIDTLLNSAVGSELGSFLSFASTGTGSFTLGNANFSFSPSEISISIGGFNFTLPLGGGPGGGPLSSLGSLSPVGGSFGGSGGPGVNETPDLPTAGTVGPTCDPNIMVALKTRAWLEAQREITQNANLIAKPDSVLEYTCFDQFLAELAQDAEQMFSENTSAWNGSVGIVTANDMDNALTSVVGTAMNAYITANFAHSFGGGRYSMDYTPSVPITGGTYTCDRMQAVWQDAKCVNFASRANDGFLTFKQHDATEVRDLAGSCSGSVKYSGYLSANDSPPWRPPFDTAMTDAQTNMKEFNETGSCNGGDFRIPTGLSLSVPGTNLVRNDTICIKPACYFDPVANNCTSI